MSILIKAQSGQGDMKELRIEKLSFNAYLKPESTLPTRPESPKEEEVKHQPLDLMEDTKYTREDRELIQQA